MVFQGRMSLLVNAGVLRDLVLVEVIAAHQLVGGVTAHQGEDG